jgi:uncharacterized protein (TIGR00299 family) protein
VVRSGVSARKVDVGLVGKETDRNWKEVRTIIAGGELEPTVRDRALRIFRRLFEAEAKAHGLPVGKVHLHEAGARDAIVDIVGACVGFAHLDPERIVVSPMTPGSGTVRCEHGLYPVPGPATTLLLRGAPLTGIEADGERLTPTGAAILTTVADAWGGLPRARVVAVGHGAGSHDFADRPNVVRMMLCEGADARAGKTGGDGEVLVVEFTVDDATPQALAFACERLFEAGALDVFTSPAHMKKGRTGHHVTVLCSRPEFEALTKIVLEETTTLGLRFRTDGRIELGRSIHRVKTPYGPVRVKVGHRNGVPAHAWPEYEDCAGIARRRRIPLHEVQQAALESYRAGAKRPPRGRKDGT